VPRKNGRQIGRPSKIYDVIHETRCPACGDWIRSSIFQAHRDLEHRKADRAQFESMEIRAVPVPERIVELTLAGNYLETAARACGIDDATLGRWLNWGAEWTEKEEAETPEEWRIYRGFRVAVMDAREIATSRMLRHIEQAAPKDWKAGAWILERTRAPKYSQPPRIIIAEASGLAKTIEVLEVPAVSERLTEMQEVLAEVGLLPGGSTNGTGPS